ncbi:hypothetical protein CspHIS471_0311480 [Cutaneotrichosporon sp. HIS471]|nr:hypothetical protein CspHIS471_0311480 [Cutaneotrichosporon sp. HIS471]
MIRTTFRIVTRAHSTNNVMKEASVRSHTKPATKDTWSLVESDLAQAKEAAAGDDDEHLATKLSNLTVTPGWDTPYGRKILINLPSDLQKLVEDGYHVSAGTPTFLKVYVGAYSAYKTGVSGVGVNWGDKVAEQYNVSERLPSRQKGIDQAFLMSAIRAIETCPHTNYPLEINCGSDYLWRTVASLHKWHDNWPLADADIVGHLLVLLRERKMSVRFKYIRGHQLGTIAYNLARQGASLRPPVFPIQWLRPNPDTDESKAAKHLEMLRSIRI